jgi:hypothetical protein
MHCQLPRAACAFWTEGSIPEEVPKVLADKHVRRWREFYDSTGLADYGLSEGPLGSSLSLLLGKNTAILKRGEAGLTPRSKCQCVSRPTVIATLVLSLSHSTGTARDTVGKDISSCRLASLSEVRQLLRDTAKEYFPRSLFYDALEVFLECEVAVTLPRVGGATTAPAEEVSRTLDILTTEEVERWTQKSVSSPSPLAVSITGQLQLSRTLGSMPT